MQAEMRHKIQKANAETVYLREQLEPRQPTELAIPNQPLPVTVVRHFAVTSYFSKSGTKAPPREYYAWSQELLSVYRLGGNKENCGWAFSGLFSHSLYLL